MTTTQKKCLEQNIKQIPVVTNSLVSPGTHLVKTHESQSRNSESPFKKKKNYSEIENAGPLVNQAVDLKTDSKTLYYCIL